jgi:hypothetical protein
LIHKGPGPLNTTKMVRTITFLILRYNTENGGCNYRLKSRSSKVLSKLLLDGFSLSRNKESFNSLLKC